MNDTGGGVTAIHDVPGDITRIGFHWMLLFFLSVTRRGLLFVLHTECRGGHGVSFSFLVPNYRILSSHGISRTVTDFLFLFLSRDLSLDPLTNGR